MPESDRVILPTNVKPIKYRLRLEPDLAGLTFKGSESIDIQVVEANVRGDRKLHLQHAMHQGVPMDEKLKEKVLAHIERLWGHEVEFSAVDAADLAA